MKNYLFIALFCLLASCGGGSGVADPVDEMISESESEDLSELIFYGRFEIDYTYSNCSPNSIQAEILSTYFTVDETAFEMRDVSDQIYLSGGLNDSYTFSYEDAIDVEPASCFITIENFGNFESFDNHYYPEHLYNRCSSASYECYIYWIRTL